MCTLYYYQNVDNFELYLLPTVLVLPFYFSDFTIVIRVNKNLKQFGMSRVFSYYSTWLVIKLIDTCYFFRRHNYIGIEERYVVPEIQCIELVHPPT